MAGYVKTAWVEGLAPGISAINLNNLEDQVDDIGRALKPPIVIWTIPGWHASSGVNQAVAANRTYYQLIYVAEDTTYDRIGIYVGTGDGAGGAADLRIFDEAAGIPTDEVLSAGTVSTNGAGAKEIVIAETLVRGYYFLAARFDQAPTCSTGRGHGPVNGAIDTTNVQFIPSDNEILYDDAAYADPAGAIDGMATANFCFVRLREA